MEVLIQLIKELNSVQNNFDSLDMTPEFRRNNFEQINQITRQLGFIIADLTKLRIEKEQNNE
jgi:hypothetical protein